MTGDLAITANFVEAVYLGDFDRSTPGDDPADWIDTAAGNSLAVNDDLFEVINGFDPLVMTMKTQTMAT